MSVDSQFILLALGPVFVLLIGMEAWFLSKHPETYPTARYSWTDALSNAALALLHQASDAVTAVAVILLYDVLFGYRLFSIPDTWWSFLLLFVLQDFLYYWFHRAHHRIRWCWAAHVVHHSSERLNLSTAFRQSLMYPVSGMWAFWIPLVIIGFKPEQVITMVMLSLAYQFFIHTQVVRKMGWLELVLNTPSHHRVHHARNPEYIDRNYGGTLIIWDRLFGTFVEEKATQPCEFGIVRQIHSHNPLTLTFHEWRDMFRDVLAPGLSPRQRLHCLFGPPDEQASHQSHTVSEKKTVPGLSGAESKPTAMP